VKIFVLPKSVREVFRVLSSSTYTPEEIHEITGIPARTIRFAINLLKKKSLIIEKRSFNDMRKRYCTSGEKIEITEKDKDLTIKKLENNKGEN